MNPIILIPARMASTRLPNKPLVDIAGKPMIVRVWEQAMASGVGPVVVACDDVRIAKTIENIGGRALLTRNDHASGSDRIWEALGAVDADEVHDVVINLQGDLPTLEPHLINDLLAPLQNKEVDIATLAAEIVEEAEKENPSVVKPIICFSDHPIIVSSDHRVGRALYFTRATAPHGEGPLYHHIGLYAYRRAALERFVSLSPSSLEQREKLEQLRALEAGMRIDVAVVNTVPLGVDTQEDLEKVRRAR